MSHESFAGTQSGCVITERTPPAHPIFSILNWQASSTSHMRHNIPPILPHLPAPWNLTLIVACPNRNPTQISNLHLRKKRTKKSSSTGTTSSTKPIHQPTFFTLPKRRKKKSFRRSSLEGYQPCKSSQFHDLPLPITTSQSRCLTRRATRTSLRLLYVTNLPVPRSPTSPPSPPSPVALQDGRREWMNGGIPRTVKIGLAGSFHLFVHKTDRPARARTTIVYPHQIPQTHDTNTFYFPNHRRFTRSASPSAPRTSSPWRRSAPSSLSAPSPRTSAPRALSVCPPRSSRSPPARLVCVSSLFHTHFHAPSYPPSTKFDVTNTSSSFSGV